MMIRINEAALLNHYSDCLDAVFFRYRQEYMLGSLLASTYLAAIDNIILEETIALQKDVLDMLVFDTPKERTDFDETLSRLRMQAYRMFMEAIEHREAGVADKN